MSVLLRISTLAIVLIGMALPAWGKTLYVSDQLAVNLRSEPSGQSSPMTLLRTDAAMELLSDEGEYYKVRLEDGTEGYFPKRYATDREPRAYVIARLEKKIASLEAELAAAEKRLGAAAGDLEEERQQLVASLKEAEQQLKNLEQEQATILNERDAALQKFDQLAADSSDVVALGEERDRLRSENARLSKEMALLQQENESLLISGVIKWFLAGAGVLFFGWLIGRASRRKRGGLSGY